MTEDTKNNKIRKCLPIVGLSFITLVSALALVLCTMFTDSTGRNSTPSGIAAQEEFQKKLMVTQQESIKKMDAIFREAHKLDSIGK